MSAQTSPGSASAAPDDGRRYVLLFKLASGGAADVFVGAARGALGFRQLVAIKRPHPHLVEDPAARGALLAEARLAARLHHANVVDVRDVELEGDPRSGTVQLVMDYVDGEALGALLVRWSQGGPPLPAAVAIRIVLDAAAGLHAAHELVGDDGQSLGLVHRDVSPQNVLVGLDGVARVADFGIAKGIESSERPTTDGALKGKVGYMSPEYVRGHAIDRRADVFALGVVLWEALTGKRLFRGASDVETLERIAAARVPRPSEVVPALGDRLDAVVARALERIPEARWPTARAFASALEDAARPDLVARAEQVAEHVRAALGDELEARRKKIQDALRAVESQTSVPDAAPPPPVGTPRRSWGAWLFVGAVLAVIGLAVRVGMIDLHTVGRARATAAASTVTAAREPTPASASATSAIGAPSEGIATSVTTAPSAMISPTAASTPSASSSAPPRRPHPPVGGPRPSSTTPQPPPNPYKPSPG